jgi:hypothetical protein
MKLTVGSVAELTDAELMAFSPSNATHYLTVTKIPRR